MANCLSCGLPEAPPDFTFPKSRKKLRELKHVCKCIKVSTLSTCVRLSIANARRYLEDAQLLLSKVRLAGTLTSALLCVEECGRARLALNYLRNVKDITFSDYDKVFCNHSKKIEEGLSLNPNIYFAGLMTDHQESKEDAMYVSYDYQYGEWEGPWSLDIGSVPEYSILRERMGEEKFNETMARMREAQGKISGAYYPTLLKQIGYAIEILQKELSSISKK